MYQLSLCLIRNIEFYPICPDLCTLTYSPSIVAKWWIRTGDATTHQCIPGPTAWRMFFIMPITCALNIPTLNYGTRRINGIPNGGILMLASHLIGMYTVSIGRCDNHHRNLRTYFRRQEAIRNQTPPTQSTQWYSYWCTLLIQMYALNFYPTVGIGSPIGKAKFN